VDTFANHLDTVETHLLQEIAARSAHFFEAAGVVQDLRSVLTRTFHQVSGLRKEVGQPFPCPDWPMHRQQLKCIDWPSC
jgi:hypothetical protein